MDKIMKKLGEAEFEIMQVIWETEAPVTSSFILKELQERRKFHPHDLIITFG